MTDPISNRYEFVLLFDVKNGNPNGDPDGGNLPRIDPETGHGITTDVCLKRKVRNYVELVKDNKSPFVIYVKERAVLAERRKPAYDSVQDEKSKAEKISKARIWMCQNFFDVRTFGAVMSTKDNNCGQVRGPVQFTFSESIDPIVPLEASITRMAVETKKEADSQGGDNRTMGRKAYVPYGLYRSHGFVSAPLARQTGFTEDDLELLWNALIYMFDHDRSASRGEMATQKLFIFKHNSELGNAPAHKLFDLIKVERKNLSLPARKFSDYQVDIEKEGLPGGVELFDRI
ncbi:type I-C CRISPR-associated protein Cas7/Csd2 [Desulfotignum phosphitoxidans]|uniref:CRISPR subtype I-C/DVULG-associated protein Cas7/Csd2 n=1 Tax=Desulfotignum phosphitoxidans DSM 13687 TaxID=1286635 RepID=S0FUZ3_9BACT|nr:type I-C CRISPR-associated protein Cas7/Csd2 [Desulfotignum phosphitoxidans]EMS78535.1 CRISPR subtype I-C/DVULG-associated protein Cas7/Csd2 [Desulfotignum phosphitoxidans DSM 13687]